MYGEERRRREEPGGGIGRLQGDDSSTYIHVHTHIYIRACTHARAHTHTQIGRKPRRTGATLIMIFNPMGTGTASIVRPAREQVQTVTRRCRSSPSPLQLPSFFFSSSFSLSCSFFYLNGKLAFSPSRASFPSYSRIFLPITFCESAEVPTGEYCSSGEKVVSGTRPRRIDSRLRIPRTVCQRNFDRARIISLACPKTRRTSVEGKPSKKSLR